MLLLFWVMGTRKLQAQPPPPKPLTIHANPAQGLIFGAFFRGPTGGTITVFPDGSRGVTGSITEAHLGYSFSPAIFEIEVNAGTLVSIMNGPDVLLVGNNGGTVTLSIGSASTGNSFVTTAVPPTRTQVRIGGTLTVGNPLASPSGNYNGSFSVTFIQE